MPLKYASLAVALSLIGCGSTPVIVPVTTPATEVKMVKEVSEAIQKKSKIFSHSSMNDPLYDYIYGGRRGALQSDAKYIRETACKGGGDCPGDHECEGGVDDCPDGVRYLKSAIYFDVTGRITIWLGNSNSAYEYLGDGKHPIRKIMTEKTGELHSTNTYTRDSSGNVLKTEQDNYRQDAKYTWHNDWKKIPSGYKDTSDSGVWTYKNGFLTSFTSVNGRKSTYNYVFNSDGEVVTKTENTISPLFESTSVTQSTYDDSQRIIKNEYSQNSENEGKSVTAKRLTNYTYEDDLRGNWVLREWCTTNTLLHNGKQVRDPTTECEKDYREIKYH